MNCLKCSSKACKTSGKDCPGTSEKVIASYSSPERQEIYNNADFLISHGRAGSLSRLEEIAEFVIAQGYKKVGLAYCFGMEKLAIEVSDYLKSRGINLNGYRCTVNGIKEKEIHSDLGEGIGCNPLGQAAIIESDGADFVIEMGLCMGHDVLFHQGLTLPFTVFLVKDRVWNHCPAKALPSYTE